MNMLASPSTHSRNTSSFHLHNIMTGQAAGDHTFSLNNFLYIERLSPSRLTSSRTAPLFPFPTPPSPLAAIAILDSSAYLLWNEY